MKKLSLSILLQSLTLLLLLTACSSAPKESKVKFQPLFDFTSLKFYSLYNRNHKFNDYQGLGYALRNDIELAIERGMEKQGFNYKDVADADVVVTYFWVNANLRDFKRYNKGVNYCSYCLNHSVTGAKRDRLNVTPGSLVLDVIDTKSKRSVWRSSYPLKVNVKDNSLEVQSKVHQAIGVMLSEIEKLR